MQKKTLNSVCRYICLVILLALNLLFSIKYISRFTDYYLPISLATTALSGFALVSWQYMKQFRKYTIIIIAAAFSAYIILAAFLLQKIPIETLNVDRWSVITSFWQNFELNQYVYFAKSHMGNPPGPMPFYFILAYPFYLMGELGIMPILAFPLFILLLRYEKIGRNFTFSVLFFLLFSPFLWWEIVCRSNIFLNSTLILCAISFFLKKKQFSTRQLIITGIIFGLLLSTRNVFAIALIIPCIFNLRAKKISPPQTIVLSTIIIATFITTFIPFIWNFWNDFLQVNPFIIQSSALMPAPFSIFFILLSFVAGNICRTRTDVFLAIALNLFFCILTYFLYQVSITGWYNAIFGWVADLSYFIFFVPFALLYWVKSQETCYR